MFVEKVSAQTQLVCHHVNVTSLHDRRLCKHKGVLAVCAATNNVSTEVRRLHRSESLLISQAAAAGARTATPKEMWLAGMSAQRVSEREEQSASYFNGFDLYDNGPTIISNITRTLP